MGFIIELTLGGVIYAKIINNCWRIKWSNS